MGKTAEKKKTPSPRVLTSKEFDMYCEIAEVHIAAYQAANERVDQIDRESVDTAIGKIRARYQSEGA